MRWRQRWLPCRSSHGILSWSNSCDGWEPCWGPSSGRWHTVPRCLSPVEVWQKSWKTVLFCCELKCCTGWERIFGYRSGEKPRRRGWKSSSMLGALLIWEESWLKTGWQQKHRGVALPILGGDCLHHKAESDAGTFFDMSFFNHYVIMAWLPASGYVHRYKGFIGGLESESIRWWKGFLEKAGVVCRELKKHWAPTTIG